MAMYEVIGMRPYSFTGEKGELVKGTTIYCITDSDDTVEGRSPAKNLSLSPKALEDLKWQPQIGDMFVPEFNAYGRLVRQSFQKQQK